MPPQLRAAAERGLSLRTMTDDDDRFDAVLFASVRGGELAMAGLPLEQLQALLDQQHRIQNLQYRSQHPDGEWLIVEHDGRAVGRLYLAERENSCSIIDISLLPETRGQGLGGALLSDVISHAAAAGKPVELQVARTNPALRLYLRLGFVAVEDMGFYLRLKWTPDR